jgi:hypothetical protein
MERPISRFSPMADQADGKDRAVILSPAFFMFCQLEVGLLNDTLEGATSRSLVIPSEATCKRIGT